MVRGGANVTMPSRKKMIGIAVVVATTIAIVVVALWLFRRLQRQGGIVAENFESGECAAGNRLIFFNMEKCPHCINFKSEWSSASLALESDKALAAKVCMVIVSATEVDKCKEYKVDGFPTVIFETKSGKRTEYDGPRTSKGLTDFMRSSTA